MILIGTIWAKIQPEVMTNVGWIKMSEIDRDELVAFGISGKIAQAINKDKRPIVEGTCLPITISKEISRQWQRITGHSKQWLKRRRKNET